MEQSIDTSAPVVPVEDNKQKGGKGWIIATAIVSVVAICGIGFGIYGVMQGLQKDSQISDLEAKINDKDEAVTTIGIPETEAIMKDDTKKYIYIGEWGLKFKIPSELHQVEYKIRNARNNKDIGGIWSGMAGTSSLLVFGLLDENSYDDSDYKFSTYSPCTSAAIVRVPKSQGVSESAFSIGDYDFVFEGWQYPCVDVQGNSKPNQTGEIIRNALTNPDNYSAI